MTRFCRVALCFAAILLFCEPVLAEDAPAPAGPKFELADVHGSPQTSFAFMRGGNLVGDSFVVRQATIVDLIANAYHIDRDNVLGGPPWLDTDRFDISARAPRTTSKDNVRLMLRSLLVERFALVAHSDTKPLAAFGLTVGRGGPKMKQSDETANSTCQFKPPANQTPGPPLFIEFECHGRTMEQLARDLHNWAGNDYLNNRQTVDQTKLKGAWDFNIRWTPKVSMARAGADAITLFDAVDKQLGLKLDATTAPLPVVIVDTVNEKPTPNPAGVETALPPPPPAEFEVAVIKPSPPDTRGPSLQITGEQVKIAGAPLQFMIAWAWNFNPGNKEAIVGAPKGLNDAKFDILAKVAPVEDPATGKKVPPNIDFDTLQGMIRALITERFNLKMHTEDRPQDAYTLVAVNPRMKKSDPLTRTGCKEGPGPDGKDPRIANPILGRLMYCQNMTMAQFGDQLRTLANGYIFAPVVDGTGLKGGYDFTLSFSTIGQLNSIPAPAAEGESKNNANPDSATDPNG